jgi:hypothetical protein
VLIDKIAKEMSIEQFINHLEKDIGSVISFIYEGQTYSCPSQIGLIDVVYIENDCDIGCNACWLRAIKDVDFKDECRKYRQNKVKYKVKEFNANGNIVNIKIEVDNANDADKIIEDIKKILA